MKKRGNKGLIPAGFILFGAYALFMMYNLFSGNSHYQGRFVDINITPFKTIKMYITYFDHFDLQTWTVNVLGNVLAFVPLGFFLAWLFPVTAKWWRMLLVLIVAVSAVEVMQFSLQVGSFDVDDILLNTFGGMIGYVLLAGVTKAVEGLKEKMSFDL
ncbi:VanZ family protein [Bacillus marinisedimentorum]|uniref:VanZ family protein n=1 Tax=Bacillus marinisedimentorum TaxID=1821260 RepID=UPI0007E13B9E|nr:VanZ family protein [Bacillus marinisedimentorum]